MMNRYKYLKNCRQRIWERWSNEYLKYLRERHNLAHKNKVIDLNVGDVVIIKGDGRNRAHWKTGIVDRLIKGKDGIVRGACLRAGKDHLERAIQHLYPLELHCDRQKTVKAADGKTTAEENEPRRISKRTAAAIAKLHIHDQVEEETEVPQIE